MLSHFPTFPNNLSRGVCVCVMIIRYNRRGNAGKVFDNLMRICDICFPSLHLVLNSGGNAN